MMSLLTIFVTIKPITLELQNVMYNSHTHPDNDAKRTNNRCGFFERSRGLASLSSAFVMFFCVSVKLTAPSEQMPLLKHNDNRINVAKNFIILHKLRIKIKWLMNINMNYYRFFILEHKNIYKVISY